jgi:anti-repressor protein
MNEIQIFNNPEFGEIRTLETTDGKALFCGKDVAEALGYKDTRHAVSASCRYGVKCTVPHPQSSDKTIEMIFIPESDVYRLTFGSKLPTAEKFTDWVTEVVLPSIRKTGSYAVKNMSRKELALMIIQQEEEMEVLRLENKKKEETLKEQKPKVVFADAIVGSKSSCLIGELAKIITQNGYEIGQNRLFAWMRMNHYLGTVGEYYNIPCQKYLEMGLFELKKNVHSQNGQMVTTITPKVTGKGQQYFVNKFLQEL